jgi:hypothetical protein
MTLTEIDTKRRGFEGVDWINVAKEREKSKDSVSIIMNHHIP